MRRPLDAKECHVLAEALGDTPETVIAVHLLRRAFCKAYVVGDPSQLRAAILYANDDPTVTAFGSNPEALWAVLKAVHGWNCVNVNPECATALGDIIGEKMATSVRYYGDIYHTLVTPVPHFDNEAVRQLTLADLKLLQSAPAVVRGSGFGTPVGLLEQGFVASALMSGSIVSLAHTHARSDRYADIGVSTLEQWRGRGFATAAAAIVAQRVREAGQISVWRAREDNAVSLRVAEKLGFAEVSRRTYVILDKPR